MVVPNGTLFGDGVAARIKEEMLREFNLHTVVRLPNGVFAPYTSIPTNLLFFDRSGPTKRGVVLRAAAAGGAKNYTKTNPLRFEEFADCIAWWGQREENERAWGVGGDDTGEWRQPRHQEPEREAGHRTSAAGGAGGEHLGEGATHRGDHERSAGAAGTGGAVMIAMPPRNTSQEQVALAASKCLRFSCERHFASAPLGRVAQVVSGGTPDTGNLTFWDGGIVWVTPKDLGRPRNIEVEDSGRTISQEGLARSSARLLPAGAVLLSSRAPIGHVAIAAVPLCTNQGFKNIVCGDALHNRFLFHMLRASIDDLQALGRGNTFLEIPARTVQDFSLPLPPLNVQIGVANFLDSVYLRLHNNSRELPYLPVPLDEQRRIVARIEALAARIAEARGLRQEAMEEADSLMASTISGIFAIGETNGWKQQTLGDLTVDVRYGTSRENQPTTHLQYQLYA